jgi:prepilin-type processing-associated H-X9-DG protein
MQAVMPEDTAPELVAIIEAGRALLMERAGLGRRLDAERLRAACRCAGCTVARRLGGPAPAAAGIRISTALPVGGYGLNIGFSDGHARGLFPFSYLDELVAEQA